MSWSVNRTGRAAAVALALEAYAKTSVCSEPEESIRQQVIATSVVALKAMQSNQPVVFEASGSQSTQPDGTNINQLAVSLKPLWGFIE